MAALRMSSPLTSYRLASDWKSTSASNRRALRMQLHALDLRALRGAWRLEQHVRADAALERRVEGPPTLVANMTTPS
jgi:hypothetical protein